MAKDFGFDKKETNEFTAVARQIETAFHGRDNKKRTIVIFAETESDDPDYRFVLPIQANDLLDP